ncbi:MAG: adenylate/guanylate cyclase domain-containing protein [Dongiaceae bacterium]
MERRLAAILAADVVGYSRLMEQDEAGTLETLKERHKDILAPLVAEHLGRIVKVMGDGVLVEFASAVNAVACAVELQKRMAAANDSIPEDRRAVLRIGINLGDVIVEGSDLYGDGVNLAARLERIAEPGGICLSRSAYDLVKGKIDARFADIGERRLKNIAEPLQVFRIDIGLGAAAPAPATLPLPDKPSIVVLPFTNLSDDPEHAYFADGVTEDLTTALSRLRWLFVIARNSAFVYKGEAVDVRTIARELGVRYALEGSVRTAGQRIRITGQLIDAENGKHIWAEKYDRQLHDIFAVQDEITEHIVAAIEPHLYAQEGYRAAGQPPESIDVWGLVVRAIDLINKFGRKDNEEAQRLLRRAIEIDPHYARAHATLSWAIWWATLYHYVQDRSEGFRQSAEHAQEALRLDQREPWARMTAGLNLSTSGQHQRALAELRAALNLNPSFALARTTYGWALLRAGRFDDAITETEKALRMSPMDSFAGLYTTIHGLALLAVRRFADALPHLRASVAADAEFAGHYNALISCCGHLGLIEEAAEFVARRNKVGPPLRVGVLRNNLRDFAHCDVFVEGLIKAGVPE